MSWLSLLQHYGTPTRLLDFSFSPLVAAYFAIESGTDDATIFCVDHKAFKRADRDLLGSNFNEIYDQISTTGKGGDHDILYAFEPKFSNQRMLAQQGICLLPNGLTSSHGDILNSYNLNNAEVFKFIIPSSLRKEGIRWLKQMNINASTLFPGLEGYCKSLRHQLFFILLFYRKYARDIPDSNRGQPLKAEARPTKAIGVASPNFKFNSPLLWRAVLYSLQIDWVYVQNVEKAKGAANSIIDSL